MTQPRGGGFSAKFQVGVCCPQFQNVAVGSLYNISDIDGIKYLTKLQLKFSALNEHKFGHLVRVSLLFALVGAGSRFQG